MRVKRATIHAYWLMFIATVITVGIVTSSQLITDRIGLLLDRQASELLAGDLVLVSSNEFSEEYREQARNHGLQVSRSVSMRSAIFVGDNPRLVELKAVDSGDGAGYDRDAGLDRRDSGARRGVGRQQARLAGRHAAATG